MRACSENFLCFHLPALHLVQLFKWIAANLLILGPKASPPRPPPFSPWTPSVHHPQFTPIQTHPDALCSPPLPSPSPAPPNSSCLPRPSFSHCIRNFRFVHVVSGPFRTYSANALMPSADAAVLPLLRQWCTPSFALARCFRSTRWPVFSLLCRRCTFFCISLCHTLT
jgi:hypothetical protein